MDEFAAFEGLEVEQVWVWSTLRIVFDLGPPGEPSTYVDVTQFGFTDSDGEHHTIDVERDPVAAGVVLGLIHQRVTDAAVTDWELRFTFDNGAKLVCPPDERWEAWQASLPDSTMIFCPIGGGANSPS